MPLVEKLKPKLLATGLDPPQLQQALGHVHAVLQACGEHGGVELSEATGSEEGEVPEEEVGVEGDEVRLVFVEVGLTKIWGDWS